MTNYALFEVISLAVLVAILVADLLLILKRPHIPSAKESTLWVVFYVSLALIFALTLGLALGDWSKAQDFVTGWALEYSLSIDNLFVFVLLMTQFRVPRKLQQEVLMIGIIIALVLRGIFILLGSAIVERFTPIFFLFGAFLLFTAWKQAFGNEDEHEGEQKDNAVVRLIRKRVDIADDFDGNKLRTVVNGKRIWTPMLLVLVAIGLTDLMFAIDSIPAIFAVTRDPFIIFTANIFALMGLRQLYFLLGGLLDKLRYLHYGIAFLLGYIGVKLILHALNHNTLPFINGGKGVEWAPDLPTWLSLTVIAGSMGVATIASLIASARDRRRDGVLERNEAE